MKRPNKGQILKSEERFKSYFEQLIANTLGDKVVYEPDKLNFVQPAKNRTYTPDFKIREHVYIEAKGLLSVEDRHKMVWVKEQHPHCIFYLLFQNAYKKLSKRSKTTYADWATKNGFNWAHMPNGIPKEWFKDE